MGLSEAMLFAFAATIICAFAIAEKTSKENGSYISQKDGSSGGTVVPSVVIASR